MKHLYQIQCLDTASIHTCPRRLWSKIVAVDAKDLRRFKKQHTHTNYGERALLVTPLEKKLKHVPTYAEPWAQSDSAEAALVK